MLCTLVRRRTHHVFFVANACRHDSQIFPARLLPKQLLELVRPGAHRHTSKPVR